MFKRQQIICPAAARLSAEGCALGSASQDGSSSSPHSRHQAYERGPVGDLRSERRACGSTMYRWREARVPSEPDALPFRYASLFGVPREGHASGCEVKVSDQHEDRGQEWWTDRKSVV